MSERVIKYLLKDIYNKSGNPIGVLKDYFRKYKPCKKVLFINKVNKVSRNTLKEYQYLKKVVSNMCRAIKPKTYDRYRYFITFLDRATRYLEVKLLRRKKEVYEAFLEFKSRAENNPKGYRIRIFATNNSSKYVNKRFQSLFKKEGITH